MFPPFSLPKGKLITKKMADKELDALRLQVRKRRKAATDKISRMRRVHGVDIADTGLDPRRDNKVIKHYTKAQLTAYLNQINQFQDRSIGFVLGSGGTPLPKQAWQQYKRLEEKYNSIGGQRAREVGGIFIPTTGMTIQQREATLRPDSVQAQGAVVNRPFSVSPRQASHIPNTKALTKLIRDMQRKLDTGFLPKQIKKSRKELNQMLKTVGNAELIKRVNLLSDAQFDVMWNFTAAATIASMRYEIAKSQAAGASERWFHSVVEDASADLTELFDWAKSLPTQPATKRNNAKPKKTKGK